MYTVDTNAAEPIMLINKQIGPSYNEDGSIDYNTPYTDGASFQEELLYLDSLGKKRIQVWINSPGGSITHGMNIYNAILKSKTPVDTYNTGIAASIAGAVFMAGRKRYMCDYAQFMMHPVGGVSEDHKAHQAFTESVTAMLQAKSGVTADMVRYMMNVTTYLPASKCLEHGICTDIEVTRESNTKYMPTDSITAMMAFSNNITEELLKTQNMNLEKVANKLGLNPSANEDTILTAISAIETARNQAEQEAQAATTAREEAEARVTELTGQLETAQADLDTANAATAAAQEAQVVAEATELVNSFKAKVGDKPEVLAKWVNMAKVDMVGTKELLESIPLNKVANKLPTGSDTTPKLTAHGVMLDIQNRNKANN